MRPRRATIGLLLVLCASPAAGERLAITTYSSGDGLGSSFVNHILQDSNGYSWFATRDGLSRWNGYEFTTLGDAGLPGPAIDRVYQTRSGEYFVIANDGSLHSYLPRRGRAGQGSEKIKFRRRSVWFEGKEVRFNCLFEDSAGLLWGGGHGVLVKGVGSTDTPIPLAAPASPGELFVNVRALVEDRAGTVWVATERGLFRVLADESSQHYALAPRGPLDIVSALALDDAGRLWIGQRWLGLVVLDPGRPDTLLSSRKLAPRSVSGEPLRLDLREGEAAVLDAADGLPANSITSILATSDGHMWVGTDEGLARFDGRSFARYTKENGLCDNLIYSLAEAGDGSLWVSTPTGAMRVVLGGFSRYTTADGLSSDRVAAFAEAPRGTLHAVGNDWSINTFDGRRFRAARLPLPAGSTSMWAAQAAYRDREGRWWALTGQGLYRFDRHRPGPVLRMSPPDRVYTIQDGLRSSGAFRVYEDRAGAVWIGSRTTDPADAGLARLDPDLKRVTSFGEADGIPPRAAPSAFAEDREGNLWVGFYQGGLARYRGGRFQMFGRQDGIPEGMVTALLVDARGSLWISTNLAGLGRIDRPSADRPAVRTYSTRDGLASNNVRALVEDRHGRVYAGTARGVDRLDPATGRVRHYAAQDGLVGDFVTGAFADSSGDLWFATFSGVFRLTPRLEGDEEPPPIAITGLRISGEAYPILELGEAAIGPITLGPDQRDIEIGFVSVSRRQAAGVAYQYAIGRRGASWTPPGRQRSVNFARLSPGDYVFAVRAVTAGGKVSSTPATFTFRIRPPVVQRWWFISLVVAISAGLLLAFYRYRVGRLLEMERLRVSLASDLHDEVAANLSSIATFSAVLRGQAGDGSPFLDRITALATESVDAMRDIIWSIDPKPETIQSLLVRLRDAMVTSCRARGLHLTVSVPAGGLQQNLTPQQRKNIWLMLKEAVTNAARHSGGTEIFVSAAPGGGQVRLTVRDNGHGHAAPDPSPGRGLGTMRARASALGGTLVVRSLPAEGTSVEFVIPLPK
jgi:ligand-binding sensor domain-containing protein